MRRQRRDGGSGDLEGCRDVRLDFESGLPCFDPFFRLRCDRLGWLSPGRKRLSWIVISQKRGTGGWWRGRERNGMEGGCSTIFLGVLVLWGREWRLVVFESSCEGCAVSIREARKCR